MDNNEKNRILAEWVGFKPTRKYGGWYDTCPDFIHSFDACLEYLVPKLHPESDVEITRYGTYPGRWWVLLKHKHDDMDPRDWYEVNACADTAPLSLCDAFLELIEAQDD